jgi:hypothetical protein
MNTVGGLPMEKSKTAYLLIIFFLLVITAYMTTAYLVKLWPFAKTNSTGVVDLSPIAESIEKSKTDPTKTDFSKGIVGQNQDPYIVSDGNPYDCGDYSITFPNGWLIVLQDKGKLAISNDLKNSYNSICVSWQKNLGFDTSDLEKSKKDIGEDLGSDYSIEQVDLTDYMNKKCLMVYGTAQRNDSKVGMMAMAIPSSGTQPGYWVIGFFDPKDSGSKDIIFNSMASISIKLQR